MENNVLKVNMPYAGVADSFSGLVGKPFSATENLRFYYPGELVGDFDAAAARIARVSMKLECISKFDDNYYSAAQMQNLELAEEYTNISQEVLKRQWQLIFARRFGLGGASRDERKALGTIFENAKAAQAAGFSSFVRAYFSADYKYFHSDMEPAHVLIRSYNRASTIFAPDDNCTPAEGRHDKTMSSGPDYSPPLGTFSLHAGWAGAPVINGRLMAKNHKVPVVKQDPIPRLALIGIKYA